ncbi:MAG TPA: YlxR family protein [Actinomycetota bacterium]|nr:YlxR family protein [Actinomycetota bacterium]
MGCRDRVPKKELIRIVRGPAGEAVLDPSGSAPGRGAYLHRVRACVEIAFSRGSLTRALRTGVSADRAATLMASITNIEEEPRA